MTAKATRASLALCCMSHSPLLNLPGPSPELLDDIDSAVKDARRFVRAFDPELVVIFSPDHYNGFFYRVMPPFCIGTAATGVGDYGTHTDGVYECRNLRQLEAFVEKLA